MNAIQESTQSPSRFRLNEPSVLLLASFAVHLTLWALVVHANVQPLYDEVSYLQRAHGFHDVIQAILTGNPINRSASDFAYGNGVWAPLHSIILGLAMFLPFGVVPSCRLVVTIIASCTILVIYGIGLQIANKKAAIAASVCFLIYPAFLAFSHLLWSETLYTFLFLSAIYSLLLIKRNADNPKIIHPVTCGLCIGLAALTRAAAIPAALTILAFVFIYAQRRRRALYIGTIIIVLSMVVSPWLLTLYTREGRFVPLSTIGGFNIYLGNNRWIPEDCGAVCSDESLRQVNTELRTVYNAPHNYDADIIGKKLGMDYIKAHPASFLHRCALRLRMTWTADIFLIRHIRYGLYGPIPEPIAWFTWALVIAGHAFIILTGLLGMLDRRLPLSNRGLFIALAIAGSIIPALTVTLTRYNYPTVVLMLPFAGYALCAPTSIFRSVNRPIFFGIVALFLLGLITSLPFCYHHYFDVDGSSIRHYFG